MSLLSQAKQGVIESPKINLVFGPNKVGKTSLVTAFPRHIIIDIECGSNEIKSANRLQGFDTLAKVEAVVDELLNTPHDYKTVGLDSVEALESLIFDFVCSESGVKSIEEAGGGYGKGYTRSREIMRGLMGKFRALCDKRGVEVFLIGHSQTKEHNDPITNIAYTKYLLRTNDKMAAIVKDLADNIVFLSRKMMSAKKDSKEIAVSDNKVYAHTRWNLAYDAGCRQSFPAEFEIDKDDPYGSWTRAKELGRPITLEDLKAETAEMIKALDKETREKAQSTLMKASTVEEVAAIKARVQTLVTT